MASTEPVAVLTDVNAEHECLAALSDTAQELLKFRLYKDTEGVWVCCDWCGVWRYVAEEKDPAVFFKQDFHCKEVKKKCNVGVEEGSNQVFYGTKFCAGSLVWAKRPDGRREKDWLWWPALVEDSPDSVSQYFLLDESSDHVIAYHVTYMDAYRTCGWVESNLVKPFDPQSRALNKVSASRAGKKQRFLKEALERAKNAAAFNVVDRLENFSYIAHMGRLKGLIKPNKAPADKILNGTQQAPQVFTEDLTEEGSPAAEIKRARGRPRKRKLDTSETEVMSEKAATPEEPVTVRALAAERESAPLENESVEEMYVEIPTKTDPKTDVDSGYANEEESPIEKPVQTVRKRAAAKTKKTGENGTEPLGMSGFSSQDKPEESQPARSSTDKPKKQKLSKSAERKETPTAGTEDVKVLKKTMKKVVAQDSRTSSSEPLEPTRTKAPRRKTTVFKDSVVESLPVQVSSERVLEHAVSNSVGDVAASDSAKFTEDSGNVSSDGRTASPGFVSSIPEEATEKADYGSDSNTLESTVNLKVVRKRRSKKQDFISDENKPPKTATFTQPSRKDKPSKTLGLSKRQDSATSVKSSNSLSMSQPLPTRGRGKFAPPTKTKTKEGDYYFDDLSRDLDEEAA